MAEPPELVNGDGWISDESDFLGDDSQRAEWEDRLQHSDPRKYFSDDRFNINRLAAKAAAEAPAATRATPSSKADPKDLYNPFEGKAYGRQLSEPVSDFLKRLPPSTTKSSDIKDWIWIANPFTPPRAIKADIDGFKAAASAILREFEDTKTAKEHSQRKATKAALDKSLVGERAETERKLLQMAREYGVTSGKWMFFPLPEEVDRYWGLIAPATARGELGVSAKTAADEGKGERVGRLTAVYTADYENRDDVRRVLLRLKELGLVPARGPKLVYYKCDAWTYLNIESGNPWGIKASMYSSNEMLRGK